MAEKKYDKSQSLEQILNLIHQYANLQFDEHITGTCGDEDSAKIISALNLLGDTLRSKMSYFQNNQKRIDEILDVLMTFTMSDFTKRAIITDNGDELDAIALGLNTLAEELEAARIKEHKYIHDLESANKELKSFTHLASHDLREPLRNLKMFSGLIVERERENLSDRGKQLFEKVIASSIRMENLIEDLLAFSRVQTFADTFKAVDLNDIVKQISLGLKSNPASNVTIDTGRLPVVNGMPVQLHQLFSNIISNSIKYAKENVPPIIQITCCEVVGSNVPAPSAEPGKPYFKITFSDNGIGFEQKYAERIFEIFQRLHTRDKYSGTGMGLAVSKKIVENHSGFIYAAGVEDVGAVFTLYLPV